MSNTNSTNHFFNLSGPIAAGGVVAFDLAGLLHTWRHRRYERQALATLDAHLLADIGLDVSMAAEAVRKPFWQA